MSNYELEAHHVRLLEAACEMLDRAEKARRVLQREGEIADVPDVPMLTEAPPRDITLDNDGELAALLEALPEYHRGWVALAAYTGWRRVAILSRQWSDIGTDSEGTRWLRLDRVSSKNKEPYRFRVVGDVARILDEQRRYVDLVERATDRIVPHVFFASQTGGRSSTPTMHSRRRRRPSDTRISVFTICAGSPPREWPRWGYRKPTRWNFWAWRPGASSIATT